MGLSILKPGLLTTIQDAGRFGYRKDGVVASGPMDAVALTMANLLVGNADEAAALEITLMGPVIRFEENHLISLTGADLSAEIDGERLKLWRPVWVKKGSVLTFGKPETGCRAYLAVSGSFAVQQVLGSTSTYTRAGMGGLHGTPLQEGDFIPCPGPTPTGCALLNHVGMRATTVSVAQAPWTLAPQLYLNYQANPTIRAVRGPEYRLFSESSKSYFWNEKYQLTPQSDRMGYRLQGVRLALEKETELLSSAVTFGTVQIPAEGSPVILMADHQTTGGYPRIAQIAMADLPLLAQLTPGSVIRFKEVLLEEAQLIYINLRQQIEKARRAIRTKIS